MEEKEKTARDVAIELIRKSVQRLEGLPDDDYIKYAAVVFDMCYKVGDI